jgi:hypothetical protein
MLEGLERVGYKLNYGRDNMGLVHFLYERAGGFYLGASLPPPCCCPCAYSPATAPCARRRRVPEDHRRQDQDQVRGRRRAAHEARRAVRGRQRAARGRRHRRHRVRRIRSHPGFPLRRAALTLPRRFGDFRAVLPPLVGAEKAAQVPPAWGINDEHEVRLVWRELPTLPNMWPMMGESRRGADRGRRVAHARCREPRHGPLLLEARCAAWVFSSFCSCGVGLTRARSCRDQGEAGGTDGHSVLRPCTLVSVAHVYNVQIQHVSYKGGLRWGLSTLGCWIKTYGISYNKLQH